MTALEARYLTARNRAFTAWLATQPQLTLPGTDGLDEQDVGASVLLVEPAVAPHAATTGGGLTSCGTEPRRDPGLTAYQSVTSEHPNSSKRVVVGAALTTATETGANHSQVTRARLREGV